MMPRLSLQTAASLAIANKPDFGLPRYLQSSAQKLQHGIGIVHLGPGAFFSRPSSVVHPPSHATSGRQLADLCRVVAHSRCC